MEEQEYYILEPVVDTEETGHVFPAIESCKGYDFKAKNSVHNIKFDEFPKFVPNFCFSLKKNAKLTDLLSQSTISAFGLIVSTPLADLLLSFRSVNYMIYPLEITLSPVKRPYYFLHFVYKDRLDFIDFESSLFVDLSHSTYPEISIKNQKEYLETKRSIGRFNLSIKKLKLGNINFDIFPSPVGSSILITASLKNTILSTNFSGIKITPFKI